MIQSNAATALAAQEAGPSVDAAAQSPIPTTPSRAANDPVARSPGTQDDLEDDDHAELRLARSRDRNREHARRTRLRKKQQLESLQGKVKELQDESKLLKQTIEECSIASILLELSNGDERRNQKVDEDAMGIEKIISKSVEERTFFTVNGKRKRFVSDADCNPPPMKLKIKGKVTLIGGNNNKAQINWKTGVYVDEDGQQKQLTPTELEGLRRERNRMHAKMTRDRKKLFISSVEKTIADLEEHNKKMREILAKQALRHSSCVTPDLGPMEANPDFIPSMISPAAEATTTKNKEIKKEREPQSKATILVG